MQGPTFGENVMNNQTDKEDLPPASVREATVEKARKLEQEMLARSARKRTDAANESEFGEDPAQPAQEISLLPYVDREDDELVVDPKDGKYIMKKYQE
jgi:hypothetical protein